MLSILELWMSPRSCALNLLTLASLLRRGLDSSLAFDSDSEFGSSEVPAGSDECKLPLNRLRKFLHLLTTSSRTGCMKT